MFNFKGENFFHSGHYSLQPQVENCNLDEIKKLKKIFAYAKKVKSICRFLQAFPLENHKQGCTSIFRRVIRENCTVIVLFYGDSKQNNKKIFRQIFGFKFSISWIQFSSYSRLQRPFEGFENIRVKYKIRFEKIWKFVHPGSWIWRFQKIVRKYVATFLFIDFIIY